MIPMGTVVTVCMFTGVVFASHLPPFNLTGRLPLSTRRGVGVLVMLAGTWNVLWYGVQHFAEYWGIAALVSGILMMLTSFYIIDEKRLPALIQKARPVVLVLLLICACRYAFEIYHL